MTFLGYELDGLRLDANALVGVDEDNIDTGRTQGTITRETGKGTLNEITGRYTPTVETLYTNAMVVFPIVYRRERQERIVESAARMKMYRVLVPWNAQGDTGVFRENDKVVITTCDDADFVGKQMRVTDVMHESDQAFRRMSAVDWFDSGEGTY